MQIPSKISDECTDALVELCFLALPAVDADELARLIGAVLRIAAREVRRAATAERERLLTQGQN
jgi:hypothetical protein